MAAKLASRLTYARSTGDTLGAVAVIGAILLMISFWLSCAAAQITHVIVCIKASAWILLLFGCIVAPVGVIHGFGVWLGVF